MTRGWQHGGLQAGCFGSTLCHTSRPLCCQPSPCHATQVNRTQRRSRAHRVGIAPLAGTRLSNLGLGTALQKHWGVFNGVAAAPLVPSFLHSGPATHPAPQLTLLSSLSAGLAPQSRSCGSPSSKGQPCCKTVSMEGEVAELMHSSKRREGNTTLHL